MADSSHQKIQVTILGCGLMGTALLQGWLQDGNSSYVFTTYVRSKDSQARLESEVSSYESSQGLRYVSGDSLSSAVEHADIVVLGVPPKELKQAVESSGLSKSSKKVLLISLLAGVSLSQLRNELPENISVARVIPTLAAKMGDSVTLVAENPDASAEDTELVRKLFADVGSIQHVPEALMNEATAIGASVNALAIVAIDAVTDASVAEGVPRETALALAAQSLRSVCGLMLAGKMGPEAVKASMSTPSGITINAIVNLEAAAKPGIAAAARSAIQYTRRMND